MQIKELDSVVMFDPPEAPREMMPTDAMMKFYNCSDFPFNFNFIVDLTVLTLLDDLTGELLKVKW